MTESARTSALVTWGLFGAWVLHDIEELATIPRFTRELGEEHPRMARLIVSPPRENTIAISTVGAVMAAAAWDGARTDGRGRFYQAMLAAFGWHAVTHVAQTAALRRYTPGVVTAVALVAPYSVWAWRRLGHAGVLDAPRAGRDAARWGPPMLVGARVIGRVLGRTTRKRG
jgi:hypothetical protein